jgi:tetratricopeptide (TPR) repeat protein
MPAYGDLPSLRAALSQARQQQQSSIDDHLTKADAALRAGKVSGDGDDNALAQYQDVLKIDPANAKAQAGLGQVAQALLLRASASIDAQDYPDATRLVDQAAKLAPHSSDLAAVRSRLKTAQADAAQADQSKLDPSQRARVDKLLARARAAVQAGDFLLPPGASAYDLYSEVLNIDGNNQDALQGLQGLAGQARTRFDQSLSSGDLPEAGKMLQVLAQLVPGDAAQAGMRRRLASAWLDRAERKLNDGDRAAARQALDAAGKLRPDAPRLQSLRTRIGSHG